MIKGNYGHKTDVWSCGVVLYGLMTANFPFDDDEEILNEEHQPPVASADAASFISGILEKEQEKRMSAAECNRHTWMLRNIGDNTTGIGTTLDIADFCGPAPEEDSEEEEEEAEEDDDDDETPISDVTKRTVGILAKEKEKKEQNRGEGDEDRRSVKFETTKRNSGFSEDS